MISNYTKSKKYTRLILFSSFVSLFLGAAMDLDSGSYIGLVFFMFIFSSISAMIWQASIEIEDEEQ